MITLLSAKYADPQTEVSPTGIVPPLKRAKPYIYSNAEIDIAPLKSSTRRDPVVEHAADMEPEHARLWIYHTDDQQTVAFTPPGWNTCESCSRRISLTGRPPGLERMATYINNITDNG